MKITKYIHSCLQIEKDSDRILFDPGLFTFAEGLVKPSQFQNIQAIIITHKHPDHIDGDSLKQILDENETAIVLANSDIAKTLAEKDIEAEIFETGERAVGGFVLEASDAPHEAILADELPQNTAYIIDRKILHPGDSYSKNLFARKGAPVLCLPIMAPWATEIATYDFAVEMSPELVVPIHDGYAKGFFLESRYQNFKKYFDEKNIKFQWMSSAGDYVEL
jgi:L-ascorbate metabolism protein UlaG (beta-lactamase superfamily)